MSNQPSTPPADGMRASDGFWLDGNWHPHKCPADFDRKETFLSEGVLWERCRCGNIRKVDAAMWRIHHEPGSVEEACARSMRFDKYVAMQALIIEIANCAPADNHAAHFGPRAKALLAGMQPTFRYAEKLEQGARDRALARSHELEVLAIAYRVAAEPYGSEEASTLTVTALEAWEREHQR